MAQTTQAAKPTDQWYQQKRIGGLRRFALAITALNVLGHTVLGFEQSWAQPLVALATGYFVEIVLEWVDSWANKRPTRFGESPIEFVDFILSAHISSLAVSMLLYANETLWPVAFAVAVAIGSKHVLRVATEKGKRHFMNPSNLGISATLLLFPWIGIAPPYHFTENTSGVIDWILPVLIIVSGTFLNWRFTSKLPLIGAWLGVFALQAIGRTLFFDASLAGAMLPMTGLAFVLFTFYMVTDPATTPSKPRSQIIFGASVALVYSFLMVQHVVFGLFFALSIVCAFRGVGLFATAWLASRDRQRAQVQQPAVAKEA